MTGSETHQSAEERLEACMRLAVQMHALSGLYQGVVHDLKSPLNALVVNLELLRSSLDPDHPQAARQQRYAQILHEELLRMNRSIERLLPATAPERSDPDRFDLRELAGEVVSFIAPQARQQRVKILAELDAGAAPPMLVTAHRNRVKQALLAMVVNALEAMPAGGELAVAASVENRHARVSITDTGPGVPAESAGRIYDLYYSTKEGHLGLGLYVAHRVVKSAKGSIELLSGSGGGAHFDLLIPFS